VGNYQDAVCTYIVKKGNLGDYIYDFTAVDLTYTLGRVVYICIPSRCYRTENKSMCSVYLYVLLPFLRLILGIDIEIQRRVCRNTISVRIRMILNGSNN